MTFIADPLERPAEGLPSGVEPIDREWGGLYRGGAYLVYGRAASGRNLLTLRFAATGIERGERCLMVASERVRDLAVEAASIGLDLRRERETGSLQLTRVPPLVNLRQDGDEAVARALSDLAALIRRERPDRVVVNDFMPFVMFRSFERFQHAFVEMLEVLDGVESTMLVALPEPVNDTSRRVVDYVASKMAGSVHIETFEYDPKSPERRLTLRPHVGHLGSSLVSRWDLGRLVAPPTEAVSRPPVLSVPVVRSGPPKAEPPRVEPAPWSAADSSRVEPAPSPAAEPSRAEPSPVVEPPPEKRSPGRQPLSEPPWFDDPIDTGASPAGGPSVPTSETTERGTVDADRSDFEERLERQFAHRDRGDTPFLLLAMRLDPGEDSDARPFDFEFLIDLVSDAVRDRDDVYVDAGRERIVAWLADSMPDDATDFFARLRRSLEAEAPGRAAELLHSVAAIVVPDGRPFATAAEFMDYALEEA